MGKYMSPHTSKTRMYADPGARHVQLAIFTAVYPVCRIRYRSMLEVGAAGHVADLH